MIARRWFVLALWAASSCATTSPARAPEREENVIDGVEQEAKWTTDEATFARMYELFRDGTVVHGMRCSSLLGAPRMYVDRYLDTPDGVLAAQQHVLRRRQRFVSTKSVRLVDPFATLESAPWQLELERLQYKSAPVRQGAIWLRAERGHEPQPEATIAAALRCEPVAWSPSEDNPLTLLLEQHPGFDCAALVDRRRVVQYRYHVVLSGSDGKRRFMLSFDRLRGATDADPVTYHVELEAMKELHGTRGGGAAAELVTYAATLEREFALQPVTTSKSAQTSPAQQREETAR